MRLSKKGKQRLISMLDHTNDYIELLMNAEILCEYLFYPAISLCFKAPATLHNLRQFIIDSLEYGASTCWTLIG